MPEQKIQCPSCQHKFEISSAMSSQLRSELLTEFQDKENLLRARLEGQIKEANEAAAEATDRARTQLTADFEKRLKIESNKAANLAAAKAAVDLGDLQEELQATKARLDEANTKELELRKAQRDVENSKRELELTLTRRLDEERIKIATEAGERVEEDYKLKAATWNTQRESMERLIEDLKKKAEQGSTQTQGEAFELEVESTLKETFPHDSIEPVAKGVKGSDVIQRILTRTGQPCGAISYELKRTKNFTEGWIQKSKDDMRAAKADIAVIITQAMPEGIKHIGQMEGVWICDFQSFIGLALALRSSILEVAHAKQALVGKKDKMDSLYEYLSGPEFRGRVEAVVEAFSSMREDLESEKRAFDKIWAKRQKALDRAMNNTAGMYGDLQGIIGSSLQEIPALALETK